MQESVGFLSLPREIRDMIYEYCIAIEKNQLELEQHLVCLGSLTSRKVTPEDFESPRLLQTGALLYACHEIGQEFSPMFYGAFRFRMFIFCKMSWDSSFESWIQIVDLQISGYIIDLIKWRGDWTFNASILEALERCSSLHSLEFGNFEDHRRIRRLDKDIWTGFPGRGLPDERDVFVVWLVRTLAESIITTSAKQVKFSIDVMRPKRLKPGLAIKDFIAMDNEWAWQKISMYLKCNNCPDFSGCREQSPPVRERNNRPIRLPQNLRTIRIDGQKLDQTLVLALLHTRSNGGRFFVENTNVPKTRLLWQHKSSR